MQIISETKMVMVGVAPPAPDEGNGGVAFPDFLQGFGTPASFLAVANIGPCDCYCAVSAAPGLNANPSTGNLIAAANYAGLPGFLRNPSAVAIGPFVAIPLTPGDLYFSAIAIPVVCAQAETSATAASDSTTLIVDDPTRIAIGQTVADFAGAIPANTLVSGVSGNTITISQATTAALSDAAVQFSAAPSPQPPGILAIALGI
jgi:hypothetical protein